MPAARPLILESAAVYQISKATKNVPRKYRVRGKWFIAQDLLRTQRIDQESEKLVQARIDKQKQIDDDAEQAQMLANKERLRHSEKEPKRAPNAQRG